MMRKGAGHCPTKSAQSSLPMILSTADAAIDPIANPRNKDEGSFEVWLSTLPVKRSSISPLTLVSMHSPVIFWDAGKMHLSVSVSPRNRKLHRDCLA